MLIDHHMHFNNNGKEINNYIKKYKIDNIVLFSVMLESDVENPYKKNNLELLDFSNKNKKVVPFMVIHPILDSIEYIKKESHKFEGYKINCNTKCGGYSYVDIVDSPVLNYILERKKPIIFHTGYKEGQRIKNLMRVLNKSSAPIIFAHAGRFIEEDLLLASKNKNAFVDICPLNVISENERFVSDKSPIKNDILEKNFSRVIVFLSKYFSGRIVWGSDAPYCDSLTKDGYEGELKVYRELVKLGENSTFLHKNILKEELV